MNKKKKSTLPNGWAKTDTISKDALSPKNEGE